MSLLYSKGQVAECLWILPIYLPLPSPNGNGIDRTIILYSFSIKSVLTYRASKRLLTFVLVNHLQRTVTT